MEARLIIALDDECKIYETLKVMVLKELDTYMVENFEDSSMVREHPEFKVKIESFLLSNENYVGQCSRKNNGYIRVVYTDEDGNLRPLKAYYKKDKEKLNLRSVKADIKRKCVNDLSLLREIYNNYSYMMAHYHRSWLKRGLTTTISKTNITNVFSDWIEQMASRKEGYFYIRKINRGVEKYIEEKEKRNKTISINSGKIKNIDQEALAEEEFVLLDQEPHVVRCIKAALDPDELFASFDLDDLQKIEPDELPSHVKTKRN